MGTKKMWMVAFLMITAMAFSAPVLYADQACDNGAQHDKAGAWKHDGKKGVFKDLNLTEEQKKLLEDNKAKNRSEMKAAFDEMKKKRDEMRQELQKEKLDMGKVTQITNDIKKLESEMSDRRLQSILEVRRILSPEQFKKFMSKMEERKEHFKPRKD